MILITVSLCLQCVILRMNGESVSCESSHKINKVNFTQKEESPSEPQVPLQILASRISQFIFNIFYK